MSIHKTANGDVVRWREGGKNKGRVPPINELELSAGRHELELVNPAVRPYRAFVSALRSARDSRSALDMAVRLDRFRSRGRS